MTPRTVLAALAVVAAATLATGCSASASFEAGKYVSQDKVEGQVADELEQGTGNRPEDVACEDDLKAEVGATVRCELTAGDGSTIGSTVEVTEVKDSQVSFHIQVDELDQQG
jgi:hypothetical protein